MVLREAVAVAALLILNYVAAVRTSFLPPIVADIVSGFESRSYDHAFREVWGQPRKLDNQGQHVELVLNNVSKGGGFISQDRWYHGFFSAAIKLPGNYSAGVITTFYTSNQDLYPKTHDEFDFEFLGVLPGQPYILQTNIYGHGSTKVGREERLHLWFDPTTDYHHYSILWNQYHTVFFVDSRPIRELKKMPELGLEYPSKPQTLFTSIWDGSPWATEGGRYPVDYSRAPYKAYFKDIKLEGCVWNDSTDPIPPCAASPSPELNKMEGPEYKSLTSEQEEAMHWVRQKYLWYSYCDDVSRYPEPPVDCPRRQEGVFEAGASQAAKSYWNGRQRQKQGKHDKKNP